jgi:ferredoxin
MHKIIHYRNKCIGCGICYELQPEFWRMSKKDGKVSLLNSTLKKDVYILQINKSVFQESVEVAQACPVKIIKVL